MEICDRLILIDDDAMFNYLHKRNLAKHGYALQINDFINAGEALKFIKHQMFSGPCIILLDINMPEMDGWTFLEELQQMDHQVAANLKVIMLSSSVSSSDVTKASGYKNVCGYLFKPLNIEMLKDILSRNEIVLAGAKGD